MSEPRSSRRIGRSIGALVAGALAVVVLSIATDIAMFATGVFPSLGQPVGDALLLVATGYRTIYGVLGSSIAARLAPERPMGHALTLGVVGLVLSIVGAVTTWGSGPVIGHEWYPLSLVALAVPGAWVGGKLGASWRARATGSRALSRVPPS
jgi:hypothetical protein